jgi:hypothetical protein
MAIGERQRDHEIPSSMIRSLPRPLCEVLLALTTVLSAVALAAGTAPSPKATATSLSAEQIVARNVAARGGLEAWRKVGTMVWVGHIQSADAPVPSMQFTLEQQRPNRTRLEINTLGQKSVRVFDGAHGWKARAGQNGGAPDAQPYTAEELKFARGGQGIDGPLIDSGAKGNVVTLGGVEEIEGHKAYRLEVQLPVRERDSLWIDAKTFLDMRCDRVVDGPGPAGLPRKVVSLMYRDYKTFDGLKMPSVIETSGDAHRVAHRIVIERVAVNPPLDPWAFVNPATPHLRPRSVRLPDWANPVPQAPGPVRPSDSTSVGGESPGPEPK